MGLRDFLRGMGSIFNLFPHEDPIEEFKIMTAEEAAAEDYRKLCGDGQKVFGDLTKAYEKETKKQ